MLKIELRPRTYHDSIVLMQASARMLQVEGTEAAMAAMATPLNLQVLRDAGLWDAAVEAALPGDLVLAARGLDPDAAIQAGDAALRAPTGPVHAGRLPARTVRTAARELPGANLAVISVPGEHAAWPAWDALSAGLNVFCFSDNVAVEDEVQLKDEALRRGLLFMGPDCGTAIVDGVGLGFWNAVPRGRVGIVGASGTGVQQLCCLLAHQGVGISHAIGVGGRDLSPEVGGRMAAEAVRRLDDDPDTELIVLVSKPTEAAVRLTARKPLLQAVLGPGVDLTEVALRIGGGELPPDSPPLDWDGPVDGIFSGGTLCEEAALVWRADARPGRFRAVDYGADEHTRGRPHPMIDSRLRLEAVGQARGLVYLDVVLGHGAHPDPAAELAPALAGRPAVVVLVGTEDDPQGLSRQRAAFEAAGARVYLSNSRAARSLVRSAEGTRHAAR